MVVVGGEYHTLYDCNIYQVSCDVCIHTVRMYVYTRAAETGVVMCGRLAVLL